MRRALTRSLLPLAALALGLATAPVAAAAVHPLQTPIGPNQYFKGLLRGQSQAPVMLFVTCATGAATGHAVAGQQLSVEETGPPVSTNPDVGYTGSKGKSISATVGTPTLTAVIAHFTGYGIKKDFPTALSVPCSGSGSIAFAPAPTSKTAHTAVLGVTFGPPPAPDARR